MSAWTDMANAHAARWEHGHAQLTSGCALCVAEYDALMEATAALRRAEQQSTKEHP